MVYCCRVRLFGGWWCIRAKAYLGWEPGVLRYPGNRGPPRMGVCLQISWLKRGGREESAVFVAVRGGV